MFYSNEHEPIHVHGKFQALESKVEFIIEDGKIIEIKISDVKGKKANYINDYKIHFEFNDGVETTVDFKPFIFSSAHPDIKKYQDQKLFQKFNLDYGEIDMLMTL